MIKALTNLGYFTAGLLLGLYIRMKESQNTDVKSEMPPQTSKLNMYEY